MTEETTPKPEAEAEDHFSSPDDNPIENADTTSEEVVDPLTAAQMETEKWKDIAYRATAEVENFRKRVAKERLEMLASAQGALLEDLLPVVDNFRMGLEAARSENEKSMIFIGMSMVQKQLEDFLSQNGVTTIEAENQMFDPKIHEAVGEEHQPGVPEGKVLKVVRAGYKFRDKLLRAPSVIVAGAPKTSTEPSAES
jgi:molecular chaperone GrpE